MARLIISSPGHKKGILELSKPVTTLGREGFHRTELPPLRVKGRTEPVHVFSVSWQDGPVCEKKSASMEAPAEIK
jgi:hypothetical protein